MISEKLAGIRSGKLTAEQNIKQFLKKIESENKNLNIFLYVNKDAARQAKAVDKKKKKGRLAGLGIAVKACINVKGMPISCASKTLENYIGTYDADAVRRIKEEDGIILGIVNMDEFACGISGETSAFGPIKNPRNPKVVPGGSSSGSAAAVAANMCDIALGTDTGGSVRNPASHCGVVGIKPSYGRVSRYGLIDLAMSFDQIGILCKDVYGAALTLEVIAGRSENDGVSVEEPVQRYTSFKNKNVRIGSLEDARKLTKDKRIMDIVNFRTRQLSKKLIPVKLKHLNLAVQTYYPIVYVEFFSGTRKFDGRKYGRKIEENCGKEVLRRILGGREISKAEYHGSYYKKALAVKKLIRQDFDDAFKKVDVILLPVTPILPNRLGENLIENDPKTAYAFDAFTTPANLAGICAGVVHAGTIDGIPVGIQVLAPAFKEDILFSVLNDLKKIAGNK